jgi:hypothetical protein
MSGFFPVFPKRYISKLNTKKNCYEIIDTKNNSVFRSGISTSKDVTNQLKSLNFH